MAAKMIQRFKSQISWATSVSVMQGEHGYFFTMNKSKKDKETNKYENTPFLEARDVAALISSAQQALAFVDANPLPKEQKAAPSAVASGELPKSVADDEIPF